MCLLATVLTMLCCNRPSSSAEPSFDQLKREFVAPPDGSKPQVWWHWMNGNITKEGIKLDLEWMSRIGLGGAQAFDAAVDTPTVVGHRLEFMTPGWRDAFRYAATLAEDLHLELAISATPGWSESGGPWVKPEEGMKKLVWAEQRVAGGRRFVGHLVHPPANAGPFQDVPVVRIPSSLSGSDAGKSLADFYRDVAVIGYPLSPDDQPMTDLHPIVTTSAGKVDDRLLWDGKLKQEVALPYAKRGEKAWIQFDFVHPQRVQSMILGLTEPLGVALAPPHVSAELQSSKDGVHFIPVVAAFDTSEYSPLGFAPLRETLTFAPVIARYFRLLLPTPPEFGEAVAAILPPPAKEHRVSEFQLSAVPRVDHLEQKAAYFLDSGNVSYRTRPVESRDAIDPTRIVDLTSALSPDGTLDWTPPAGQSWEILRIGYSLLGTTNHPASSAGSGLEVDKLSRSAVKSYLEKYLSLYESILGSRLMGSHGLRAMVNDSYEAGAQNWTDQLPSEFKKRRGYDLRPWLPVLAGRIVDSAESTDRFLWDFRRILGELISENHYGEIAASLHARGMKHFGEAHEVSRAFIGDGMDAKRDTDIPMAAMWVPGSAFGVTQNKGDADIVESASVAHIYGQNLVAAESMTAFGTPSIAFAFSPESLKATADRELADGLNLFIIHTSVHQPISGHGPGLTLGPFGQWFTRNETWAEQAQPWILYLARSSYLLQQGRPQADVIYYYGQDSNVTALFGDHLPPIPTGYAFDFSSAHALGKLQILDGDLVTKSGMRYRVLAIDPRARLMSLDVLKTIANLVQEGGTIVGDAPMGSPSLADNAEEFRKLARAVWGDAPVGVHRYGHGRILRGLSVAEALVKIGVKADFSYTAAPREARISFVHRRLNDGEIYFICNRQDYKVKVQSHFRTQGRIPELWYADSGEMVPVSYSQNGDGTDIHLELDKHEAVFVLFHDPTNQRIRAVPTVFRVPLASVNGPWTVSFEQPTQPREELVLQKLKPWNDLGDVKYFSGTASYQTTVPIPEPWLEEHIVLELDLGAVKNVAEIIVNGVSAGIVWKAPFRIPISALLHPGENRLIVRVTNLWPNRLIGDRQPGVLPVTTTSYSPFTAHSPLLQSGLLGPIKIERLERR